MVRTSLRLNFMSGVPKESIDERRPSQRLALP